MEQSGTFGQARSSSRGSLAHRGTRFPRKQPQLRADFFMGNDVGEASTGRHRALLLKRAQVGRGL